MAGDPAVDLVKRPSPQPHQHSLPSLLISTVEIKLAVITKFLASAGREAAGGFAFAGDRRLGTNKVKEAY